MSEKTQNTPGQQEVSVKTTPWANPTPAGLVALAVACFGFYAMLSDRIELSARPLLGLWLLGAFVIQFMVAILDLKSGNSTGGNTFMFFCGFFMLTGGLEFLYKWHASLNGVALDGRIDGYTWLVLSLVTILWTPAFFKTPLLLNCIVFCLDVSLPFIALADMGVIDPGLTIISAYGLLLAGIIAIYLCSAMVVNTAFGKVVFPNPGPLIK